MDAGLLGSLAEVLCTSPCKPTARHIVATGVMSTAKTLCQQGEGVEELHNAVMAEDPLLTRTLVKEDLH
jgi:hypothetical protein